MYEKLKGKLILASGSPRRRELLNRMHVPFVVEVSDADEHLAGSPRDVVGVLAERKAKLVMPEPKVKTGYLARYAKMVTSADKGAVLSL